MSDKRFQIDRLYDWKKSPDSDVAATLKKQKKNTKDEFEERAKTIIVEFAQQVGEFLKNLSGCLFLLLLFREVTIFINANLFSYHMGSFLLLLFFHFGILLLLLLCGVSK